MRPQSLLTVSFVLGLLFAACVTETGSEDPGRTSEECADACWRISAADCGDVGSECVDRCLRERVPATVHCAGPHQQYRNCYWQTSAYTCDVDFGTQPTDCNTELTALRQCLATDAGDATAQDAALNGAALVDAAGDAAEVRDAGRDR